MIWPILFKPPQNTNHPYYKTCCGLFNVKWTVLLFGILHVLSGIAGVLIFFCMKLNHITLPITWMNIIFGTMLLIALYKKNQCLMILPMIKQAGCVVYAFVLVIYTLFYAIYFVFYPPIAIFGQLGNVINLEGAEKQRYVLVVRYFVFFGISTVLLLWAIYILSVSYRTYQIFGIANKTTMSETHEVDTLKNYLEHPVSPAQPYDQQQQYQGTPNAYGQKPDHGNKYEAIRECV